MDSALNKSEDILKSSFETSIPRLDSTSASTLKGLKFTDEAYIAIHTYLLSFGAIEDLFRGKMSRERYRDQVEWVSTEMVTRWRQQIDQRAQATPLSTSSVYTPGNPILQTSMPVGGSSALSNAVEPPPPIPWLAEKLKSSTKQPSTEI